MTAFVDAASAIASSDCSWPGCTRGADRDGRCADHVGREPKTPGRRAERAAEVAALRQTGMTQAAIAAQTGLSRSYVGALLSDPDGTMDAARKDRYRKPCPRCGTPMDGSNGSAGPSLCATCQRQRQHDERRWTADAIIERFRAFHAHTGRPPTVVEARSHAGAESVRRNLSPKRLAEIDAVPADLVLPAVATVLREFGSWRAALDAAALDAAPTGGAGHRQSRRGKMRLYVVLAKHDDVWVEVDRVEARSVDDAIEQVADREGTWAAVRADGWHEKTVVARSVFSVADR